MILMAWMQPLINKPGMPQLQDWLLSTKVKQAKK
jgi:hypothetical protein